MDIEILKHCCALIIGKTQLLYPEFSLERTGQRQRLGRLGNICLGLGQLHQAFTGTGSPLNITYHFAYGGHGTGHHHGVKHECRQLTGADYTGHYVSGPHPGHSHYGTDSQQHDRGDQRRAIADAATGSTHHRRQVAVKIVAIASLVTIGLYRVDLMQGFIHIGTEIGDTVLTGARKLAYPPHEQTYRHQHQRYGQQHQGRELDAGKSHHHQATYSGH